MQETSRVFIALEVPPSIQSTLVSLLEKAQLNLTNGFRPVRPGMIHLTLKFLGDATQAQIVQIQKGLSDISRQTPPIHVRVHGIGAFSSWSNPRIIWAGLHYSPDLPQLVNHINLLTDPLGFASEKRSFSAHLTLVRVSDPDAIGRQAQCLQSLHRFIDEDFGEFSADHIVLFRSELKPGGSIYTPLATYRLSEKKM